MTEQSHGLVATEATSPSITITATPIDDSSSRDTIIKWVASQGDSSQRKSFPLRTMSANVAQMKCIREFEEQQRKNEYSVMQAQQSRVIVEKENMETSNISQPRKWRALSVNREQFKQLTAPSKTSISKSKGHFDGRKAWPLSLPRKKNIPSFHLKQSLQTASLVDKEPKALKRPSPGSGKSYSNELPKHMKDVVRGLTTALSESEAKNARMEKLLEDTRKQNHMMQSGWSELQMMTMMANSERARADKLQAHVRELEKAIHELQLRASQA